MWNGKVEICGLNTTNIKTIKEEEKRELLKKAQSGDGEAREKLVLCNLRLVLSVIQKFSQRKESADDLFQVGCVGLIKAIDHFNLNMDVKFSTYAVPMIIGEVRRFLRDNNAIRVSRSMRDTAYRALQASESYVRKNGTEPTVKEIAEIIGEDEKNVSHAMEAIIEPVSLYECVYNDSEDGMYIIDQIKDENDSEEIWGENISLCDSLKKLNDREREIILLRYYKNKTQMEIADEVGISQAQVSRLEKGAIDKLKKYMS